ncbi:MAG: HD domain-containing protein [Lachnospiraceae bacterium]|nr:HD domain-containing protein [Lachnospiraceae bacterium]
MERVNKILNHDLYKEYLERNEQAEAERRFCRHNVGHLLDVARIGMLFNLTEAYGLPEELVYAAALLHDIGRFRQYEDGTPHERASAQLAPQILRECGFDDNETDVITEAIGNHRNAAVLEERNLNGLLYRADKASRACYICAAAQECNWSGRKKNQDLIW